MLHSGPPERGPDSQRSRVRVLAGTIK
uniref:Uncharacterized protein n=1 Tax=Arundo donax TaxID=35708 RepID=A0A0A8YV32_ARUDO